MANTYTQCFFHLVFSPKNRQALIHRSWSDELEMFITGIVQNHKHKMLAIKAMPDHIHILVGYNLNQLVPDLVENIKTGSNKWVNERRLAKCKFDWQRGYGAFTHSKAQVQTVINYIRNQEKHHKQQSFKTEYVEFLKKNEIEFKSQYLFEFFD